MMLQHGFLAPTENRVSYFKVAGARRVPSVTAHGVCLLLFLSAGWHALRPCEGRAWGNEQDTTRIADSGQAGQPAPGGVRIDFATELDPKIDPPEQVRRFSPRLKALWLEALARPEADVKRQAAQAIAEGHAKGMTGLAETVPSLVKELETPGQNAVVCLSAARALIALDAKQAAPVLARLAESNLDMAQIVEPALARWDHAPAREVWLRRLEASDTRPVLLALAIDGLGTVREPRAVPRLLRLTRNGGTPPDLRLRAATAVGRTRPEGMEDEARRLMTDRSPAGTVSRLAAARLLARHRGDPAQAVLLELAGDPEPAAAAIALGRLLEIDPMLVKVAMLRTLVVGPDANVRRLAAEFLFRHRTPGTVALLGPVLDDEHPAVRAYARDALAELAKAAELDAPVREAAMKMLASDRRRGLEQAAMVLGALDHKPAATRLLDLLDYRPPPENLDPGMPAFRAWPGRAASPPPPRPPAACEVNVAAAWALRRLAVPDTTERIARKLGREMDWTKALNEGRPAEAPGQLTPATYDMAEHLITAVGVFRHRPFDSRLREFLPLVPRTAPIPRMSLVMQDRLRGTAVWALGHLHAGEPDESLIGKLKERVEDPNAEDPFVARMAVIGLGRMNAVSAVPWLRTLSVAESGDGMLKAASVWSLRRITGERIADPVRKPYEIHDMDSGFLVPLQ